MTQSPKEKAVELVRQYIHRTTDYVAIYDAKKCAIIAVERELQTITAVIAKAELHEIEYINEIYYMIKEALEVKEEIEKL